MQTTTQSVSQLSDEKDADLSAAEHVTGYIPESFSEGPAAEQLPMSGTWQKDESASDAENYALQIAMLHMSSLYSYAALHYMWGVEININNNGFTKRYLVKHVPAYIFSEVEYFAFGETTTMGRRDRRKGSQEAIAQVAVDSIACNIKWGDPYAGTVKEDYQMPTPNLLHITSTLTIGDQSVTSVQVYNKQ